MVLVLLSSASLILTVFLLSHLYSVLCYLSLPLSSSATASPEARAGMKMSLLHSKHESKMREVKMDVLCNGYGSDLVSLRRKYCVV